MSSIFEKEKTVLELDGQHILNYVNILVITTISVLLIKNTFQ